MSIIMYKTNTPYYYAVEIGMPEDAVNFGEGWTPGEAVINMQPTQYQSAYFGCRGPANSRLEELFDLDLDDDDSIFDCTEEEEEEAERAYEENAE